MINISYELYLSWSHLQKVQWTVLQLSAWQWLFQCTVQLHCSLDQNSRKYRDQRIHAKSNHSYCKHNAAHCNNCTATYAIADSKNYLSIAIKLNKTKCNDINQSNKQSLSPRFVPFKTIFHWLQHQIKKTALPVYVHISTVNYLFQQNFTSTTRAWLFDF